MFRDVDTQQLSNIGLDIYLDGVQQFPAPPEPLSYARIHGANIISPSASGNIWLYTPVRGWVALNTTVAYGAWCAVLDGTYAYWQQVGTNGVLQARLDGTGQSSIIPIQPQSEGLLDVVNGIVRTCDRSQPYIRQRGDGSILLLTLWMERAGMVVGQANAGPEGVLVYDSIRDVLYRAYTGPCQTPPRLSQDGRVVAINDPGGFYPASSWTLEPVHPSLPPITSLVQLTTPKIFAGYLNPVSDAIPAWVNGYIQRSAGQHGTIYPVGSGQPYRVIDLEMGQSTAGLDGPFCYEGTYENILHADIHPTPADLVAVQCCPLSGESLDAMRIRFSGYTRVVSALSQHTVPCAVVVFIRTNYILSEIEIANGLIAASELQLPVIVFEANRPTNDVPEWAPSWLAYWRNQQPYPALPKPISASNAFLKRRLSMTYPMTASFRKPQFHKDPADGQFLNLTIQNPVIGYDGGPAAGTVLKHARTGTPLPAGPVLLCLDENGNWLGMPVDTVGIGWYGAWTISGNLASICPRKQVRADDQAFTYVVVD